ncbi:hypothetical protein LEP1GSC204_3316 [Leptospira interrogans serovar Copenhageni str. M20]|nr:hypothetical protein LEP1GSC204_3316 [Leptospira interrogans serovar Copenhageni str. M20]
MKVKLQYENFKILPEEEELKRFKRNLKKSKRIKNRKFKHAFFRILE